MPIVIAQAVGLRYRLSHPGELDTLGMLPCGELDWLVARWTDRARLRALSARRYASLLSCSTLLESISA